MIQTQLAWQAGRAKKILVPLMVLAFMLFRAACASAQTDTIAKSTSLVGPPVAESRPSGTLAAFAGFQQGITVEQGQEPGDAEWLMGAALNFQLAGAWELSPEFSLWHLTANDMVAVAPGAGPSISHEEKWYMRVGVPLRWFPITSGRFSAYALGGPAFLFSGEPGFTVDVGGGLCWVLASSVTLTGEARTFLYYHTGEPVLLASPVSVTFGVRLTRNR